MLITALCVARRRFVSAIIIIYRLMVVWALSEIEESTSTSHGMWWTILASPQHRRSPVCFCFPYFQTKYLTGAQSLG
jgi:hypothetical protein